jgi:arylsulfatase A-like enzyme
VAPAQEINPAAFGPGFLGPGFAPAIVGSNAGGSTPPPAPPQQLVDLKLEDLELPAGVDADQAARRMKLWRELQKKFFTGAQADSYDAHHALYRSAADMMRPEVRAAFDLSAEPDKVRRRYGTGLFGQGCLLARRLVERGVPFVEVALGGGLAWDTHQDNFRQVRRLSEELDSGWAALMSELQERGLLDSTTILWISEFGRTPVINSSAGRDHFPAAWTCVFAGGGIKGGQAYGRTSADGTAVEENKVGIGDVLATLCGALGVPPDHENYTPAERPIKLAEGTPIQDLLA